MKPPRGKGRRAPRSALPKRTGGELPPVMVLEITGRDIDGELLAQPFEWRGRDPAPHILMVPGDKDPPLPPGIGDRVLARLARTDAGYEGQVIRLIAAKSDTLRRVLGVYQLAGREGRVQPVSKGRDEISVPREDAQEARPGELVLIELAPSRRYGPPQGKVVERLGLVNDARSVSLIAIHEHGIPTEFTPEALREAETAPAPTLGRGADLRKLPLLTIDPPDARDHDDAVWAEADPDPKNKGGWKAIVAIADVAHYVRPGSALDREALKRGNSSYFPDRVVPMLPEALSAGLCSLIEGEDRAVLAVRMKFDARGNKLGHEFVRGLMRSNASLSYAQAQAAMDGTPDSITAPLLETVIRPLYGAFRALYQARAARHPLELELPERKIELNAAGQVQAIRITERLDAHRLIEEFMIAANVCAAETLEQHRLVCMYRIHAEPALEKLESLRTFLKTLGYNLARGQVLRPQLFNQILSKAKDTEHATVINEVILRSQSQAAYSPDNVGHFGLALSRYAHFTSPIRRYADVLVHRALIRGCKLGDGELPAAQGHAEFGAIGEEISGHERRSMAAERDSSDRYLAAFLSDRVGAEFDGAISGVTRFGLFVRLRETGADGLIPIRHLGSEFFTHDEANHALVGSRSGLRFRLGDPVQVRLMEAAPVSGGLRFELADQAANATGARRNPAAKSSLKRTGAARKSPEPPRREKPRPAKRKRKKK